MSKQKNKLVANVGLSWGDVRVEAGEPLPADFPRESLSWLLEQGHVNGTLPDEGGDD